jgi:murein DD-endopeptidase MepM/ murein hydrolase activator NlpD
VTWAGWRNNGGGLVIAIDHGNGISTVYNHLGSIWVAPGQVVSKGEGIAAVGCTGICTGPHVHFETIVGGVLVNPLRYL